MKRVPVTIKRTKPESFKLDKRTYLPAVLVAKCPKCGKTVKHDLSGNYLSYPTANKPIDVTIECSDEDYRTCAEFSVRIVVRLTVEAVPMPKPRAPKEARP